MAVTVSVQSAVTADASGGIDITNNQYLVEGKLTLTGNYGVAAGHGDIVNFSGVVPSQLPPRFVQIFEDQGAGLAPLGFEFIYTHGTTQANGKLVILGTPAAGGALVASPEFTQGNAYLTGVPSLNNVVLRFRAWFPRL